MSGGDLLCPHCGQPATQLVTIHGIRNRCLPCGLWSRGNKPLRDETSHRAMRARIVARRNAHTTLDLLWKEGLMDRETAYERLAQELGIERGACHMSKMDVETARRVPPAVKLIRASLPRNR
nr:zinc-finger-containing protein [Methylobacterium sp. 88A]